MKLGTIKGSVTATVKHAVYSGERILLVEPCGPDGKSSGTCFAAIDRSQAAPGDLIFYVDEGNSARAILGDAAAPVRAVIMGIIDSVEMVK